MGMRVIGCGSALPESVVENRAFEGFLDTSDEWIRALTGIRQRRHGGSTSGLAVAAVAAALKQAGVTVADVDLLVLATTTPDRQIPASSSTVQDQLGLACGAMDLNAACSGFVYGLVTAYGLLQAGMTTVVLVGAETLTRFTDMTDRPTAVLMADGAGAVVLSRSDEDRLLGFDLGCDGSAGDLLYAGIGSTMRMKGSEVFKRAVRISVRSARAAMARAGLTMDDVALFVPHQANVRIMEASADRLGIPWSRVMSTVDWTGNTSAASIPVALDHAVTSGRLRPGDVVLLAGFGAGMTWGSAALRWG